MKKLNAKQAKEIPIGDVVAVINGGIQLVDAAAPILSVLFNKINDWIASLGKNNPNSPKNVRLRLAALEAKDVLNKEKNKLYDAYEARIANLEARIAELEAK